MYGRKGERRWEVRGGRGERTWHWMKWKARGQKREARKGMILCRIYAEKIVNKKVEGARKHRNMPNIRLFVYFLIPPCVISINLKGKGGSRL